MSHQNSLVVGSESTAASSRSVYFRGVLFALLISTSGFFGVEAKAQAQNSPAPPQSASKVSPKKRHKLRITKGEIIGLSLKADKAKMSEVAADLSKRLGTQVILGPNMAKETITVEFYDLPLEAALRLLVPRVYIDYEIKENAQPVMLAARRDGGDAGELSFGLHGSRTSCHCICSGLFAGYDDRRKHGGYGRTSRRRR